MLVYLMLSITIVLAAMNLILWTRSLRHPGRFAWLWQLMCVAFAVFVFLYGVWVFLSVYVRYLFALLFVLQGIRGMFRRKSPRRRGAGGVAGAGLLLLLFGTLDVLYFTGTAAKAEVLSLPLPFRSGQYFVFQGGRGLPTNIFHYNARKAVYAMDLIHLDDKGRRASHIFSRQLADYYTFGDTVYSPCYGTIGRAIDDNPDNIPPERKRGPHNLNNVLIEGDHFYLFLGHLKQHAVFVKEGDTVMPGTPLGLAGNSGGSLEPHLHIQAHSKEITGLPWYRQPPLQIFFYGKEPYLFETIRAQSF